MEYLMVLVVLFFYMLIHGVIMVLFFMKLSDVKYIAEKIEQRLEKLEKKA